MKISQTECQILVIGGGGAGVTAAISAAKEGTQVVLVNQGPVARTGLTVMTGGGIQVVGGQQDPQDSIDLHFQDIVVRGHYLGDQNLIEAMTRESPERVLELEKYGAKLLPVNFFRGETLPTKESYGHSFPRGYFLLGSTMMKVLRRELLRHPEITLLEDYFTYRLFTADGEIGGALCLDMRRGEFVAIRSPAVILATGGAGELYSFTSNWPQKISGNARGVGYALALQAGAKLVDMEMTQFYPATPVWPPAIWGIHSGVMEDIVPNAGAKVLNANKEEFLEYPLVRDRTARRIYREIKEGRGTAAGGVYVDVSRSHLPADQAANIVKERVPAYKQYKSLGIDITQVPFEVAPSFHFQIGGVGINEHAETTLSGLYAAGEVSGNTHVRIAWQEVPFRNFLCLVTGQGETLPNGQPKRRLRRLTGARYRKRWIRSRNGLRPKRIRYGLMSLGTALGLRCTAMWEYPEQLRGSGTPWRKLNSWRWPSPKIQISDGQIFNLGLVDAKEIELMINTARAIATSALIREESRGAHYREDYPTTDYQNWTKHVFLHRKGRASWNIPLSQ